MNYLFIIGELFAIFLCMETWYRLSGIKYEDELMRYSSLFEDESFLLSRLFQFIFLNGIRQKAGFTIL